MSASELRSEIAVAVEKLDESGLERTLETVREILADAEALEDYPFSDLNVFRPFYKSKTDEEFEVWKAEQDRTRRKNVAEVLRTKRESTPEERKEYLRMLHSLREKTRGMDTSVDREKEDRV